MPISIWQHCVQSVRRTIRRLTSGALRLLLDVELSAGFGGLQHQFVQLSHLLFLEVAELLLRKVHAHLQRPPRRLQHLSLQRVLVDLQHKGNVTTPRETSGCMKLQRVALIRSAKVSRGSGRISAAAASTLT